jgi:hypothetical protein
VRDARVHARAIETVIAGCASEGLISTALTFSPLLGPAGNIEFLLGIERPADSKQRSISAASSPALDVAGVVRNAHETLDK